MYNFGVQGFRVEDSGLPGLRVAGFRVWRFSVEISGSRFSDSAIGDDRIRGFVNSIAFFRYFVSKSGCRACGSEWEVQQFWFQGFRAWG